MRKLCLQRSYAKDTTKAPVDLGYSNSSAEKDHSAKSKQSKHSFSNKRLVSQM